jgi:hypothetical protein
MPARKKDEAPDVFKSGGEPSVRKDAPKRQLVRTVIVGGKGYGPGLGDPPPEVAAKITNPTAWGE